MTMRAKDLLAQYRHVLPFLVLLCSSLFFQASIQRIVFYVCVPFFVWTLWQFRTEALSFVKTKAFALLALYLGYFTLSFAWSGDSDEEFSKLIRNVVGIGLFATTLGVVIARTNTTKCFPMYLVWACIAYTTLAAIIWYPVDGNFFNVRLQAWGRYVNPIHMSFLLSFAVLLVVAWWMTYRDKYITGAGLVGLLVFFIILSQTRTAFVALALCVLVVGMLGHFRMAAILIGIAALSAIAAYFCWPTLYTRILGRTDSFRLSIWQEAIEAVLQKPVLGHGIGSVPNFLPDADDPKAGWESPHNVMIGHAYHGGVVGLGIYLSLAAYMFIVPARNFWQARKAKIQVDFLTMFTLLAVVYVFCASQLNFAHFIKNVHIQWLVFWMPYACVAALELRRKGQVHA